MKFEERGVVSSYNNNVMVSQLTPGTVYIFRVSAVVENGERGAEILVSGTTTKATGGKLFILFNLFRDEMIICLFLQRSLHILN